MRKEEIIEKFDCIEVQSRKSNIMSRLVENHPNGFFYTDCMEEEKVYFIDPDMTELEEGGVFLLGLYEDIFLMVYREGDSHFVEGLGDNPVLGRCVWECKFLTEE
ncbi:MAG: hypothetical protein ACOYIK_04660 [Coriobacteriales bacterium]|jgi:hypothetical protein